MNHPFLNGKTVARSLAPVLFTLSGCIGPAALPDQRPNQRPDAQAPAVESDLDPTRAYLSLSDLQPPVAKPAGAVTVKPLSERSGKQVAAARALMSAQRYSEAALELERAFRYDPDHPEIHRMLAVLHTRAGNLERAETDAGRALKGNPDCAMIHYIIGRCRSLRGDSAAAITAYRRALLCSDFGADPEYAMLCHYYLAEALTAEGYLEAALEQYAAFEARAASPGPSLTQPESVALLQANKGTAGEAKCEILERLGRFAEAADALAPVVAARPEEEATRLRQARFLMRAGKLDDALAAVRTLDSDGEEVIQLLSEIHDRAGHPERVIEDLRSRLARSPDEPRLVLMLADVLSNLQSPAQAQDELRSYLDHHPRADRVRAKLVEILVELDAWEEALYVTADGIGQRPDRAADAEVRWLALAENPDALAGLLETQADESETAVTSYLRATLALAADRSDRAEYWLRRSRSLDPAFVPARRALAELYLRTYRYDEAVQAAARAEEDVAEDGPLERILGQVYERLDNTDRAELHFKAAIQLDRSDAEAMLALAEVYTRSRRPLQAQRQLRVLLEQQPAHERARELLAYLYLREGKVDVAYEQFAELRRLADTPITEARCAALLNQFPPRDPEAYRQALLEALKRHGSDAATWIAVGDSYSEFDRAEEQMRIAYLSALNLDPGNEEAALGLIRTAEQMLDFEEAIQQLDDLLPRRPNRHSWRRRLIDLYWAVQDYDTALAFARRQEARNDLEAAARNGYRYKILDTLWLAGRAGEAIELLEAWVEAAPEDPEWPLRLAAAYMQNEQAARAVPLLAARYQENLNDRRALVALVEALGAAGQTERAGQHALDWLFADPRSDEAVALLVSVLAQKNRVDDALELVRNQLLHTLNRRAFQNRVIALLKQAKRHDVCLEWIDSLLDQLLLRIRSVEQPGVQPPADSLNDEQTARQPEEPFSLPMLYERLTELRLNLAEQLLAAEDYREAEQRVSEWLARSRDPETRYAYLVALAWCYQEQGQDAQAHQALERALVLKPDDVRLNNDVAYGWINQGVRLDEAEPMIRYAVRQAPQQGAYLDTYGWLLYKKGAFAESRKWLTRAKRAMTNPDPVVLDHLGDACWRLGSPEEAVAQWTAAVTQVGQRDEGELKSGDLRRVRDGTPDKIDAVEAGEEPLVAPLAVPPAPPDAEAPAPGEQDN